MLKHGGVAAWTVSHPQDKAVQGQTTLQVTGTAGWTMLFPGIRPAEDLSDAMVPNWKDEALAHPVTLLPSAPLLPSVGR